MRNPTFNPENSDKNKNTFKPPLLPLRNERLSKAITIRIPINTIEIEENETIETTDCICKKLENKQLVNRSSQKNSLLIKPRTLNLFNSPKFDEKPVPIENNANRQSIIKLSKNSRKLLINNLNITSSIQMQIPKIPKTKSTKCFSIISSENINSSSLNKLPKVSYKKEPVIIASNRNDELIKKTYQH